jgi:hypothetical protein
MVARLQVSKLCKKARFLPHYMSISFLLYALTIRPDADDESKVAKLEPFLPLGRQEQDTGGGEGKGLKEKAQREKLKRREEPFY